MRLDLSNISFKYVDDIFVDYSNTISSNLTHIVGRNGSGKSTLLNIIAGKLDFKGDIYFNGFKINKCDLSKISTLVNQDINLFEDYTVEKNLSIIVKEIDDYLIDEFRLKSILNKKVKELSGGYKKKVMLLIAFMIKPKILLLDEYSNYLDNDFLNSINKKIIEYSKDNLVIYVDHNIDIGGKALDIEENGHDIEDLSINKSYKQHFIFNNNISLFKIFTYLVTAIILISTQMFYTISVSDKARLYSDYLEEKKSYFNYLYKDYDEFDDTHMLLCHDRKYNCDVIVYKNEIFDVENKINSNSKYCYVFSCNKDLLNTYIDLDNGSYLVAGVIDTKCDKEYSNYYNGILVSDEFYDSSSFISYIKYSKNSLYEDIVNKVIYNYSYIDNSYFVIISISLGILFILFLVISLVLINQREKYVNYILSSYKKSNKDLVLSDIIINTISCLIIGFISTIGALFGSRLLVLKMFPLYNPINMFDATIVLIYILTSICLYVIIKLLFNMKKSIN